MFSRRNETVARDARNPELKNNSVFSVFRGSKNFVRSRESDKSVASPKNKFSHGAVARSGVSIFNFFGVLRKSACRIAFFFCENQSGN